MRNLTLLLLALTLTACTQLASSALRVVDKRKELVGTEKCQISYRYPQIEGMADSLIQKRFNDFLGSVSRIPQAVIHCEKDSVERYRAKGDYSLSSLSDSLLSIEITTQYQQNQKQWVQYHPVTVSLPHLYFRPLEQQFGAEIWAKVDPFLKRWAEKEEHNYNQEAYHPGTKTVVNYTLGADSLVLYPGSEGEGVARHRLAIGLDQL